MKYEYHRTSQWAHVKEMGLEGWELILTTSVTNENKNLKPLFYLKREIKE